MGMPERLQQVIKRDTGIEVEVPVSIGRGCAVGAYSWMAREVGGMHRLLFGTSTMTESVRKGVNPPYYYALVYDWIVDLKGTPEYVAPGLRKREGK